MVNLHSLAIRQSVLILLGISIIFLTIFLSMRSHVSSRLSELLTKHGEEISEKSVSLIEDIFSDAADVGENMAETFSDPHFKMKNATPYLAEVLQKTQDHDMHVFAVVVAYEPDPALGVVKEYMRLATWKDGKIDTIVGSSYLDKPWYKQAKEKGEGSWTEPFVGDFIRRPLSVYTMPFYQMDKRGEKRFAGVICVDLALDFVREKVNAIPIQNEGYAFILSKNNTIVAHPEDAWIFKESLTSLSKNGAGDVEKFEKAIRNMQTGLILGKDFNNTSACVYFAPMKATGWTFGIVWPTDKFFAERRSMEIFFGWVSALGYIIMLVLVVSISLRVARPLKKMEDVANELGRGNFDVKIPVIDGKDEVSSFSHAFLRMRTSLVEYIDNLKTVTAKNERMESELDVARQIQMGTLPKITDDACLQDGTIDLNAFLLPAREVGGDFYDFYQMDEDHFAFMIADVSGKGIPAAMFLMGVRTLLKTVVMTGIPLNEAFEQSNDRLAAKNDQNMFVTVWMGILNLKTGHVDFVSAGHNPPVIRHADGSVEFAKSKANFVLGGMPGVRFNLQSLELAKEDSLFLYTDGVTEATDPYESLFGNERLLEAIKRNGTLCQNVKLSVDEFVQNAPQFDDITMLSLLFHGKSAEGDMLKEITLDATREKLSELYAFVEQTLEEAGCPMKTQTQISVAVDEIAGNIVQYSKSPKLTLQIESANNPFRAKLIFIDAGVPYNPLQKEDPDVTLSAEEREIGGLGIFLVKKTMDKMEYTREGDKNILTIEKNA